MILAGLHEAGAGQPGEVLYSGGCAPECLRNVVQETVQEGGPGIALKLMPDPWHGPEYRLNCAGKSRRDFTPYDVLEFQFRSTNLDPGNPSLQLRNWNQRSQPVAIRDHIAGGVIDSSFRPVRIPLSNFSTDKWDLGNVETLVWNSDPDRRTYYVDKIILRQTEPPALAAEGAHAPYPESSSVVRLTFSKRCDEKTLRELTNYTLTSLTDPSYEHPVHPKDVGIHYRVHGFTPSSVARIRLSVFLALPTPMKSGVTYRLRVQGVADTFGNVMEPAEVVIDYDETTLLNTNIKVNQVGYLPDAPKVGYVGGYVGDLGGAIWAAGDKGTLVGWSHRSAPRQFDSGVTSTIRSISGTREDDLYCVGDAGLMLHWNGATWQRVELPTKADLQAVHFSSDGVGWAVGADGVSLRCDSGQWRMIATGSNSALRGVWSGPEESAWAVGDHGTILRWGGRKWTREKSPTESDLHAIHGTHKDYLWAVGSRGTVLLHRSSGWSVFQATPGQPTSLRCVMTDPGGGVWIGGDEGVLWHKSGYGNSAFMPEASGTRRTIYSLTRQNARNLWAGGAGGALISGPNPSSGWRDERMPVKETVRTVFAVPYGALRLPVPVPVVTIQEVAGHRNVMTVPLRLEATNWSLSGEDVYSFDFSALKAPGIYRASISGLGVSDPFQIGEDVLDRVAYCTAHAFYYQRCGTELKPPYAEERYSRKPCHGHTPSGAMTDAAYHESLSGTPLFDGEKSGTMAEGQGGWHDAGDYGKYVPTAAAALWYLFTAYDMAPHKFTDGAWNIPESGNGVPDLLDEARWEVDWITRMQRPDGGVYHKLTSQVWFKGMPQDEKTPRFFFERTTHDTASATAVLSCAARLWRPFDASLADHYLKRAVLGWNFLKKHPLPTPKGGFRNPKGNTTGEYCDAEDVDNRLWAAAELYRTTGESEYKRYFEDWWKRHREHPWGWNEWQHFYRCAYWAYATAAWSDGDDGIKRAIREGLLRKADEVVSRTCANPYRNGARLDVPEWIGWGAFTQSSTYAFLLLQADYIEKTKQYRPGALRNLDAQLGANPLSLCFITGIGKRSPRDPLHLPSLYDEAQDPIPGLPIFGVAAHLPAKPPYYVAVQSDENSYPPSRDPRDPYPILRRYIDAHQLVPMSEFTIVDMAVCAATFHLLAPNPVGPARE